MFPTSYFDDVPRRQEIQSTLAKVEVTDLEETHAKSLWDMADDDPNEKIANLEKTVQELRDQLADFQRAPIQKEDSHNESVNLLRADLSTGGEISSPSVATLEKTVQELRTELAESKHKTESLLEILRVHEQKHQCEVLYAQGRISDAAASILEIANTASEDVRANKLIMDWLSEFKNRCISRLGMIGDEASDVEKRDEALAAYSTILSLGPPTPNNVLTKWASIMLTLGPADEALNAAAKFRLPRLEAYRTICDVLEENGRVVEATAFFREMKSELVGDTSIHDEQAQWELDFQRRCTERLDELGDLAMGSQDYKEAIEHISTIPPVDNADRIGFLIKRSKSTMSRNSWADALRDADEVIKLDPSSHRGYEIKYAALHGAKRHAEAVDAFNTMLLKLEESPNEHIRKLRRRFVDARPTIRRVIDQTIRDMPRVLIDTMTGRLYDKQQQAEAFMTLPIHNELVSSMTTQLDHARIERAVKKFYRYVMLSHTWDHDEPLFRKIERTSVFDLEPSESSANKKLQIFCALVRSLGFRWAWSDNCCIDRLSSAVLEESLVAMFTWYRASSLTVVYLRGVFSKSQEPGGLWRSIWNTRAWTFQAYVAADTIQFYTEDWKPYLGLTLQNHKESPTIISEMQETTGDSIQDITVLRPGLDRVREKLYLASMRQTTRVEDIAYSLLGIFNASIPVIYGEGNRAVGRLLEHILTGSGDVTILAWTGRPGNYNSCLPVNLTVYNQLVPAHVPQLEPIETAEIDRRVTEMRSSLLDLSPVVMLYNRLHELPSPFLAASRLRLPGIVFPLTELVHTPGPVTNAHVYHATTPAFGDIEIKTVDDLTGVRDFYLVHPWIRPLLDQEFMGGAAALDKTTQALRFLARLREPFGALLFEPLSRVEYRRVAADSLIMVRVCEEVPLIDLMDSVRTIEVR